MKIYIINLFVAIALLSYNSANSQTCQCVASPTAKFIVSINGNQQTITGNSFTVCQPTPFYGIIAMTGEVHPYQTINTGQWASTLIYQDNTSTNPSLYQTLAYTYGMTTNSRQFNFADFFPGTNTISVLAKCGTQPTTCPIRTLTVNMIAMTANVTLKTECCVTQLTHVFNGQTRIYFTGTVNCGTAYVKVEKEIGTTWVQEGALCTFVNGGYTVCYSKNSFGGAQIFRVTLVDINGHKIPTTGTTTPWTFGTYCPIPPR